MISANKKKYSNRHNKVTSILHNFTFNNINNVIYTVLHNSYIVECEILTLLQLIFNWCQIECFLIITRENLLTIKRT